jgi:hypothetical protein
MTMDQHIINTRSHFSRVRLVGLIALLGFLASCSTSVQVEGEVPKLLIPAIDRSVLFVKPPSLDYTHNETLPRGGDWSIALGPMNDVFFRELLDSMFVSVAQTRVETDGLVGAGKQGLLADVDGQIRIDLVEYGFLTPQISGLNFFSASTKFRIELGGTDGQTLGVWQVVGYGKAEAGTFQAADAVNSATVLAIRDAGARIAIELPRQSFFQTWLEATR